MSQIQASPNALGKVLGYLANASAYANYVRASITPDVTTSKRKGWFNALSAMASRDAYAGSETMDVDAIYRLSITSAWFYSGVKLIADRVSNKASAFEVKKQVGEEMRDIKNHAFEILMRSPNSLMTRSFILTYTVFWYYLKGEAYLFLSTMFPGVGEPEEIWPIPANQCRPLPSTLRKSRLTNKLCIDYEYRVNGLAYILPGENIIHMRNPNPFDYWSGLSFATALLQFLRIDYEQGKYSEEFYGRDNAVPTAIISLPADTDPELFDAAKEQIRDEFGAKRRSAIIRAGDFKIDIISQDFQKSDFVAMRQFNRDSIWQIIGIPEGINSGSASGDSRLAAETAFIRNTVQPLIDRIAEEMTSNIGPYYGPDIVIEAPSIVPADRAMLISEYATYAPDRLINENRRLLNLPPIKPTGIEAVDIMLLVPIRLFPYVSSNTFQMGGPDVNAEQDPTRIPPQNVASESGIGDVTGAPSPANLVNQQQGKSIPFSHIHAITIAGITEELKRWKKVSLKEIKAGRNPGNVVFTTDIIPNDIYRDIQEGIHDSDEPTTRNIFDRHIEDYRPGR